MKRFGIVSMFAGVAAATIAWGAGAPRATAAERPNIIVILADDLGYADLGFQGVKDIATPNLDRLAREGVRCTAGYVSHSFCSPTRAGLMTGRYQQRFGHENNPKYDPKAAEVGLPVSQTTVAQVLRGAGYATGAVGKWHLGAAPHFHPNRRGFAEFFGFLGGGHHYFDANENWEQPEYLIPIERNGKPVKLEGYLTDALSREAAAFVRRHREEPFFLYLAYNAPHTPLQAPDEYLARVAAIADPQRRTYAAMITAVDDGVGRVLGALDELKLAERTLVFFLSDNGGPIAPNSSRNAPLRGAKGQCYEGGIHVPFVVRYPGRLRAGEYREPVIALDIFPTAAAAAGAEVPAELKLDGVDILPYLSGEKPGTPHDTLFWRAGGGTTYAVRAGQEKLVKPAAGEPELYDLAADLTESHDLAAERPGRVTELLRLYEAWNAELVPPLFESPRPAARRAPGNRPGRQPQVPQRAE